MSHKFTITEFKHASWLEGSLRGPQQFRALIEHAKALLAPLPDCPVIAVTGLSGLLVGPTVALELEKYLVVVRKPNETRHSYYEVEGCRGDYNYVILDDFLQSGETVARMIKAIGQHTDYSARCIGVICYRYSDDKSGGGFDPIAKIKKSYGRIAKLDKFGRYKSDLDL